MMTTMNWENVNVLRNGASYAYDELPRAGSYRDQAGYGVYRSSPRRHTHHSSWQPSKESIDMGKKLHGMELFVKYIKTPEFNKRTMVDQKKILDALSDGVKKIISGGSGSLLRTNQVVVAAAKLCNVSLF